MISTYDEGRRRLSAAVGSGRLSHAVLLTGDFYVCEMLVRYAAARIFGKNEAETDSIADFHHVDGKNLRVANAEELLDELNVTPSGGVRVIEFSHAGQISVIIQNMLLKTIEEPPPGNHFFFYGDESGLLPTIRSRCAILNIGQLSVDEIALILQREGCFEADAVYYAALGGDAQTAVRMYKDEEYRAYCLSCCEYICGLGKADMFSQSEKNCAQGEPLRCADIFDLALSDMRRVKLGMKQKFFTRSPHNMQVKECADRLSEKQINSLFVLTEQMHVSLNSNSPAAQVFDTFAAGAEKVIGYGRNKH